MRNLLIAVVCMLSITQNAVAGNKRKAEDDRKEKRAKIVTFAAASAPIAAASANAVEAMVIEVASAFVAVLHVFEAGPSAAASSINSSAPIPSVDVMDCLAADLEDAELGDDLELCDASEEYSRVSKRPLRPNFCFQPVTQSTQPILRARPSSI